MDKDREFVIELARAVHRLALVIAEDGSKLALENKGKMAFHFSQMATSANLIDIQVKTLVKDTYGLILDPWTGTVKKTEVKDEGPGS